MSALRAILPMSLTFGLALYSTATVAQKSPEKIRLAEASKDGAVLIRVPTQPFDYALSFSKDGKSGFGSRVYIMKVRAGPPGYTYIARTLSSGKYRLDSVWQQSSWSLCLEQGTFSINVAPGRIAYVGTFHTDRLLEKIQTNAIASGRTTMRGSDFMVSRGDATQPVIDGRDASSETAARTFADQSMNGTGRLVILAPVNETAFATSNFGKAIKVCG